MIEDKVKELAQDWDPAVRRTVLKVIRLERMYLSKKYFTQAMREGILEIIEEEAAGLEAGKDDDQQL